MKKINIRTKLHLLSNPLTWALALVLTLAVLIPTHPTSAKTQKELQDELDKLQKELGDIAKQKQDLQGQIDYENQYSDKLAKQINSINLQIEQKELELREKEVAIQAKETEIFLLEEEIAAARSKIRLNQEESDELQEVANERIKEKYMQSVTSSGLTRIISTSIQSKDTSDLLVKMQYYSALHNEDRKNLENLKEVRDDLRAQKAELEEDKEEIEQIANEIKEQKRDLEFAKTELELQRQDSQKLRSESQAKMQSQQGLMDNITEDEMQLLAQQTKIMQDLFQEIGSIGSGSPVVKGTVIGREGCSGYCYGPHLHFFVDVHHDGGYADNPCDYLPAGVIAGCGTSSPSIDWPMSGTFYMSSGYGWRCLGERCSFHDAIDIYYPWGTANDLIYAAHDGWIYYGKQDGCGGAPICNDGGANYAIICENKNCASGMKTGYWHLE